MTHILFTIPTAIYYVLTLFCEYLTRYGIYQSEENANKIYLSISKVLSFMILIFSVYYSIATVWWAFFGLLAMNVIIFVLFDNLIKPLLKNKVRLFGRIENRPGFYSIFKHL